MLYSRHIAQLCVPNTPDMAKTKTFAPETYAKINCGIHHIRIFFIDLFIRLWIVI